jgi:hypothetical protein
VIIPVELRYRYYQVLREANDGDLRPFIRFIAELTERTLDVNLFLLTLIMGK